MRQATCDRPSAHENNVQSEKGKLCLPAGCRQFCPRLQIDCSLSGPPAHLLGFAWGKFWQACVCSHSESSCHLLAPASHLPADSAHQHKQSRDSLKVSMKYDVMFRLVSPWPFIPLSLEDCLHVDVKLQEEIQVAMIWLWVLQANEIPHLERDAVRHNYDALLCMEVPDNLPSVMQPCDCMVTRRSTSVPCT